MRYVLISMPASRSGLWSGLKSWPGTRSADRPCGGPARSPRHGSCARRRARGEFGRAHEQLDRAERLAAGAGAIAAQQGLAQAKTELESRQKGASPKVEALYLALSEGKWPQILAAAEAVLVSVPEHPAARQARTRAWQQIAAIGPGTAAQWPQRGARVAQAAVTVEEHGDRETAEPDRTAEPEGIIWLNAAPKQEVGSHPLDQGGKAPAAAPTPRPAVVQRNTTPPRLLARAESMGPKGRFLLWVDAVGGYLVCLDDRIVLGPRQGRQPLRMSRSWATFRGTTQPSCATVRAICFKPIMLRSSTVSRSSSRPCSTTAM